MGVIKFLIIIFSCLCTSTFAQQRSDTIRFGLLADIQYADCEASGNRFYRNSLVKLDDCVGSLNRENVHFTVNLGDLVDRDTPSNLEAVLTRLDMLDNPVHNTTGNHDYGGVTDNEAIYARLGMPSSYYSFTEQGWRFIMLNTNDVASYVNIAGTPLEAELLQMREAIAQSGRRNGASYNGGVGRRQMEWLREELETAERREEKVIVFSHHPLFGAPGLTALNDREILELLSAYPCVKAGIAGHHHPGDFGTFRGIPFITTEGMVETEHQNAYAVVEITGERITLTGFGRTRSHSLPSNNLPPHSLPPHDLPPHDLQSNSLPPNLPPHSPRPTNQTAR